MSGGGMFLDGRAKKKKSHCCQINRFTSTSSWVERTAFGKPERLNSMKPNQPFQVHSKSCWPVFFFKQNDAISTMCCSGVVWFSNSVAWAQKYTAVHVPENTRSVLFMSSSDELINETVVFVSANTGGLSICRWSRVSFCWLVAPFSHRPRRQSMPSWQVSAWDGIKYVSPSARRPGECVSTSFTAPRSGWMPDCAVLFWIP